MNKQLLITLSAALFFLTSPAQANSEVRKQLIECAKELTQVWADTILEADYYAEGEPRLDNITPMYRNNELVSYHITYSERAWYVGNCQFNGTRESLKGCTIGRIVESAYVSADFLYFYADEANLATFYAEE